MQAGRAYLVLVMKGQLNLSAPSGIQPIIRTIDADGTNRYFDLQGRMLKGRPEKGLFIENGKKIIR